MDKEQYIGITEASDPSFHLDIFDKLYKGNIIITKRLTDNLISKLIEHKDKCLLHCTVTGFGSTALEPFVPDYKMTCNKMVKLLELGFPVDHVVLRVDPVIPTTKGIETATRVLRRFLPLGIKRVRWSSLDMYDHVKERFNNEDIKLPYETFNAPKVMIEDAYNKLKAVCDEFNAILETCGEYGFQQTACLSQKDIDILGLTDEITLEGNKGQRKSCKCPKNKKELITGEKPHQCKSKCLYCFWKNDDE